MIYAPTDPRLRSIFHDPRLERTYVHHADGFDLLASETPRRLTLPLDQWLPARYLASFTWPRTAGNVWSNPELTCQHVDPQTSLSPGQRAIIELKMLVIRGSLDDALERAIRQRASLS